MLLSIPISNIFVLHRWGHPLNPERLQYQMEHGQKSPPIRVDLGTSFEVNAGNYVHALDPQKKTAWTPKQLGRVKMNPSHPKYFLDDGHHRLKAAQQRGDRYIPAEIAIPEIPYYLTAERQAVYAQELQAEIGKLQSLQSGTSGLGGLDRAWFQGSKIVTPNGEPLIVYHGTRYGRGELRPSTGGEFGPGIYLTADEGTANFYATHVARGPDGPSIRPVYVTMRNPYRVLKTDWIKATERRTPKSVVMSLMKKGYDGIIGIGINGHSEQIVAWSPDQVRSVFQ